MATKCEEIILDTHLAHTQQILPKARQHAFDIVARGDVVAVEVRSGETLAFDLRGLGPLGQGNQRGQVQR